MRSATRCGIRSPRHQTQLAPVLTQDGLQLYADTTIRDPRLWTQLGLATDHVLDELTQASVDALATLLNLPSFSAKTDQSRARSRARALAELSFDRPRRFGYRFDTL